MSYATACHGILLIFLLIEIALVINLFMIAGFTNSKKSRYISQSTNKKLRQTDSDETDAKEIAPIFTNIGDGLFLSSESNILERPRRVPLTYREKETRKCDSFIEALPRYQEQYIGMISVAGRSCSGCDLEGQYICLCCTLRPVFCRIHALDHFNLFKCPSIVNNLTMKHVINEANTESFFLEEEIVEEDELSEKEEDDMEQYMEIRKRGKYVVFGSNG